MHLVQVPRFSGQLVLNGFSNKEKTALTQTVSAELAALPQDAVITLDKKGQRALVQVGASMHQVKASTEKRAHAADAACARAGLKAELGGPKRKIFKTDKGNLARGQEKLDEAQMRVASLQRQLQAVPDVDALKQALADTQAEQAQKVAQAKLQADEDYQAYRDAAQAVKTADKAGKAAAKAARNAAKQTSNASYFALDLARSAQASEVQAAKDALAEATRKAVVLSANLSDAEAVEDKHQAVVDASGRRVDSLRQLASASRVSLKGPEDLLKLAVQRAAEVSEALQARETGEPSPYEALKNRWTKSISQAMNAVFGDQRH